MISVKYSGCVFKGKPVVISLKISNNFQYTNSNKIRFETTNSLHVQIRCTSAVSNVQCSVSDR